MTLLETVTALQEHWPPWVLLLPDDPWPQTPTGLLRQGRFRELAEHEGPLPAPGALWLPGLGEVQVVEAAAVEIPPAWGEPFRGQYSVAHAIARVDPGVRVVPVGRDWLLATPHAPPQPPVLVTCAFWLAARQQVFASAQADLAQARERAPWVLALMGLGRPEDAPVQ